jgi:hypothetical protein
VQLLSCQVSAKYSPDNFGLFPFKKHLESAGFEVAYPVGDAIIEYTLGFAVTTPAEREVPFHLTELDFLRTIGRSDVQIMYNIWGAKDGYVGESTAVETAFALMIGKPVVALREMASYSPDLAPEVIDILEAHRRVMLVEPLDKIPAAETRSRVDAWVNTGPPVADLSGPEMATINIQVALLTSKYQTTWDEYGRLRRIANVGEAGELVRE